MLAAGVACSGFDLPEQRGCVAVGELDDDVVLLIHLRYCVGIEIDAQHFTPAVADDDVLFVLQTCLVGEHPGVGVGGHLGGDVHVKEGFIVNAGLREAHLTDGVLDDIVVLVRMGQVGEGVGPLAQFIDTEGCGLDGGGVLTLVGVVELHGNGRGHLLVGGSDPVLADLNRIDAGLLHLIFGQEVELDRAVGLVAAALEVVDLHRVVASGEQGLIGIFQVIFVRVIDDLVAVFIIAEDLDQAGGEVDGAFYRIVDAADVQHQLAVDEHPHVVIAFKLEDHGDVVALGIGDLVAAAAAVVGQPEVHGEVHAKPVVGHAVGFVQLELIVVRLCIQWKEIVANNVVVILIGAVIIKRSFVHIEATFVIARGIGILLINSGVGLAVIAVHAGGGVILEQVVTLAQIIDARDIASCTGLAVLVEHGADDLVSGGKHTGLSVGAIVAMNGVITVVGETDGAVRGAAGSISAVIGERQPAVLAVIVNRPAFAAHAALGNGHAVHVHQVGVVKDVDIDEAAGVGSGDEVIGFCVGAQEVVAGGDPVAVEDVVLAGQGDICGVARQDGVILAVGDVVPANELAGVCLSAFEDVGLVAKGEAVAEAIFAGKGDLCALCHGEHDALQAGIAALRFKGQTVVQVGTVIAEVVEGVEGGADGLFALDLEVVNVSIEILSRRAFTQHNSRGSTENLRQVRDIGVGSDQLTVNIKSHSAGGIVNLNVVPLIAGYVGGDNSVITAVYDVTILGAFGTNCGVANRGTNISTVVHVACVAVRIVSRKNPVVQIPIVKRSSIVIVEGDGDIRAVCKQRGIVILDDIQRRISVKIHDAFFAFVFVHPCPRARGNDGLCVAAVCIVRL